MKIYSFKLLLQIQILANIAANESLKLLSTRNNCCEFLASDGVNLKIIHHSFFNHFALIFQFNLLIALALQILAIHGVIFEEAVILIIIFFRKCDQINFYCKQFHSTLLVQTSNQNHLAAIGTFLDKKKRLVGWV